MAAVEVDLSKVAEFADARRFHAWLETHHAVEDSIWVRIHKRSSGIPTVTPEEATRMALCWGWIDGHRKALDATSFLQRYSRRRPGSSWSVLNARAVCHLIGTGEMRPAGLAAARRAIDGRRWPEDVPPIPPDPAPATA